jgi:hypothetical protein
MATQPYKHTVLLLLCIQSLGRSFQDDRENHMDVHKVVTQHKETYRPYHYQDMHPAKIEDY